MKIEFSRQIFEKDSNIKFHKNPSSDSRDVPRGRTDEETGLTKLSFAKETKNLHLSQHKATASHLDGTVLLPPEH